MSRKSGHPLVLGLALLLVTGTAHARGLEATAEVPLEPADARLLHDPPRAHLDALARGSIDTTWFGGTDGGGVAIPGGVWDFEDGTLQGWTSEDLTDMPVYVRRVTEDACLTHGDPVCPLMNGTGSVWFGAHQDEAEAFCWPGGQGYVNHWRQWARKTFAYSGIGTVELAFDYFVDAETQFDFVYVYTEVEGVRSSPLNTSAWADDNGWGYSGSVDEGTFIGLPDDPASDTITIGEADLPAGGGDFDILFEFDSDGLYSDAIDTFAGFLNTRFGPFGLDDVSVTGNELADLADFETDADGWSFEAAPAKGAFLDVNHLDDLDPVGDTCDCPLAGNVLTLFDPDADGDPFGPFPHPFQQWERFQSPPAHVGAGSGVDGLPDRFLAWDVWELTPLSNGVGYAVGVHYTPWTCPETGTVGWTTFPARQSGYRFSDPTGRCASFGESFAGLVPADVDSIRMSFELIGDCTAFTGTACTGPEHTNQSPYLDNLRIGVVNDPLDAPPLTLDLTYQDVFPRFNTLLANATADVHSFYDNNRSDGDATNANMGDSVVVLAGTEPGTEVFLNFRIYPGPGTNLGNPFFVDSRHGGDALAPNWARARMDTAEVTTGLAEGRYSSYYWPDGQENPATDKIIPDDVLTPGSTVEYFFSARYESAPEDERTVPDTTGRFYLEFEVLPGYFEVGGEILAPCALYVDAFNAGAQQTIEELGFGLYLGAITDDEDLDHQRWDRYDYTAAASGVCAPMAREQAGDNGMTKYQSLVYRHLLYNTGTFSQEGLRNGDADLLRTWLTNDDFDRWLLEKGLWLSGNGIATILDRPGREASLELLGTYATAATVGDFETYQTLTGDLSGCVRVDPSSGRDFPVGPGSYASVESGGCPELRGFQVLSAVGDGAGNLDYVDQDGGGAVTTYASVSNEQIPGGTPSNPANYRVVIDAFSLHLLRAVPDGWTGTDCPGSPLAIVRRAEDVFTWMGMSTDVCDPVTGIPDVGPGEPGAPRPTRLLVSGPNPMRPTTTVSYVLGSAAHVRLDIHDVAGRRIRTLVDGWQDPSTGGDLAARTTRVTWDGRDARGEAVSSGVYWVRLSTSAGFVGSQKLVVLR